MRGRRVITKSDVVQFSVLAICVLISATILGPLQTSAQRRADVLKSQLIADLEKSLGITVRYGSISPAFLSAVKVRNLSVEFDTGSFVARRFQVFYNPFRMFSGDKNDPVRLISRIVVDDGRFVMSVKLPDGESVLTSQKDNSIDSEQTLNPWTLLANKTIQIRNFSAEIGIGDSVNMAASDLDFFLTNRPGSIRYSVDAWVNASGTQIPSEIGTVRTRVSTKGSFSSQETSLNGRLDLESTDSNLIVLEPISIDYTYNAEAVTARRIDDERPFDLEFSYNTDDSTWSVQFVAVDLSLRDVVSPGPSRKILDPWFSVVVDGEAIVSGITGEGLSSYDADFQLFVPHGALPWALQARVDASGSGQIARVDTLEVGTEFGELSFKGFLDMVEYRPTGRLAIKLEESLLGYPVDVAFDLSSLEGALTAEPIEIQAAGLEFEDFRFLVVREANLFTVSLLAVPGKADDNTERSLLIDGLLDLNNVPVFHGFATVKGVPASNFARFVGMGANLADSFLDDTLINLSGFIEADSESWVLAIDEALVVQKDVPENHLSFRGRVVPGHWSVDGIQLSWNGFVVDGRGYAKGSSSGGYAQGRFLIGESIYPLEARWFDDGRLEFNGEYGLNGFLGPESPRGLPFRLVSDEMKIPLPSGTLGTQFDIRGRLAQNDWDIYINTLKLSVEGREDIPDLKVDLNGTMNPSLVVIPSIEFSDSFGTVTGNARMENFAAGRSMRGGLFLNGNDNESYKVILVRENGEWNVDINLSSSPLGRFSRGRLEGTFHSTGRFAGTIKNPLVALDAGVDNAFLDGRSLEAGGKASLEDGRLRLWDLRYNHGGLRLERALAILDMNKGTLRTTADLKADYNQVPVSTGFSLAMDFEEKLTFTSFQNISDLVFTGTLATRPIMWSDVPHLPSLTFQFLKDEERFLARTPDGKALNLSFDFFSGELNVVSGAPLPIVVRGGGTILNDQISLSFPALEVDPVLINYVMVRDPILLQYHVVFQDGLFVGNLDIEGPLNDPGFFGTMEAQDLLVDTPYTYARVGKASTTVRFQENRITFDQIDVPVGDGFVYGRGYMEIDRWALTDFNMVYGGKPGPRSAGVPVYYPILNVYLDGLFTGEISMKGDGNAFWLDGDIRFPFLKASLGEAKTPVKQKRSGKYPTPVYLDFNIIAGNNCTFYLPNEQLKIVKATAEPGQLINLIYSSVPETFSFTGTLPIKSGDIYYFDRDFQIKEGAIVFNESLADFDPILSFRAETRVRDENDDEVTVALVYDAPITSDFNPRIETIPTKSELEILILFGQAVNPYANGRDGDPSAVLLATGGFLSQMGIVQPFEEVLREGLNLDMVTIRTDIIANALSEGLAQPETTAGATQSSGLGRYLDNTSLFAGKYIGNALFASGSVTANYFEGERLRSVFGGIEFATAVSLEMETPFFNIGWSYSPDPVGSRHFIEDNEFTLKWKFTF